MTGGEGQFATAATGGAASVPLHASVADLPLTVALAAALVGSLLVAGLAVALAVRRRSASRVLVALAVSTLLARTGVGWGTATGLVPFDAHHTLEHGLDVVMAGLVLAAVWAARRAERRAAGEPGSRGRDDLRADGGERE